MFADVVCLDSLSPNKSTFCVAEKEECLFFVLKGRNFRVFHVFDRNLRQFILVKFPTIFSNAMKIELTILV